jgi:hypothetical protein
MEKQGRRIFTAKSKKNRRLVYPLSMTHKSRPDYNNQELGTTKAANYRFDGFYPGTGSIDLHFSAIEDVTIARGADHLSAQRVRKYLFLRFFRLYF